MAHEQLTTGISKMAPTTHTELMFHTLRHVTEALAEGEIRSVLALGFRLDQVARLEHYTLRDLRALSQVRAHFLDIAVDSAALDRVLDQLDRSKAYDALQDDLVRLRAPLAMMRALFGMTNAEYGTRRKRVGVSGTGVGRTPVPAEGEEQRIWQAWRANAHHPLAERYLAVGKSTGIPLKVVWALVQSWEADGLLSGESGRSTAAPLHGVTRAPEGTAPSSAD